MKILSLNINNFGGTYYFLGEFKKPDGAFDWGIYDSLYKMIEADAILKLIQEEQPDIIALQEFEWGNPNEPRYFLNELKKEGYILIDNELPEEHKHYSLTVLLTKMSFEYIPSPHDLNLRASVIKVGDLIVYTTHVPCDYDRRYWDELMEFYKRYSSNNLLMVGDFNANDETKGNRQSLSHLMGYGVKDIWLEFGNPASTSTNICGGRLDYALASPSLLSQVKTMRTITDVMDNRVSDHAALVVEVDL